MKRKIYPYVAFTIFATLSLGSLPCLATQQASKITQAEALSLGIEAYIYGYPLVTMETTRKVMTNVATPTGTKAPMGQFANAKEYPNASFKDVTAPNADTLYSIAWLDLSKEPYILHVPDENNRYYLMPMLSGWTDVFAAPGARTTGTNAHNFAIIGPHWKGQLPQNMGILKAPTNLVWILGRTYSTGTKQDNEAVYAIQNQYKLVPLSTYGKSYTPEVGVVDPDIDMKTPVRDQVNRMDANSYFKLLALLMKNNPPAKADSPMVVKLSRLGIVPGKNFDLQQLEPAVAQGLEQAIKAGQQKIIAHERKVGVLKNGWLFPKKTGKYGADYLQRAFVAEMGLGANLPQDAIYPVAKVDSKGELLNGAKNYVMHFTKEEVPPVRGFWSLTLYNSQYFFADNSLKRFTLSPRDALKYNPDGSLDLYIQHDRPSRDKISNWLPAPKDNFILMLRLYWPKQAVIDGSWSPPAVKVLRTSSEPTSRSRGQAEVV